MKLPSDSQVSQHVEICGRKEPNEKVTFFAWDLYVLETFSIVKVVLNYFRETYFCLPRILFLYLFHDSLNFFNPY